MQAVASVWNGSAYQRLPTIMSVTALATEGQIDSMSLNVAQGTSKLISSYPNAPVFVSITHAGQLISFYGYLDIGQPMVLRSGAVDNRVDLLGLTNVMRTSTARSWTNQLPQLIAQDIVRPYKLGLEFDAVTSPLDFFSQADGDSDWSTLVRLADQTGHSLSHANGIVRLLDVSTEVRRASSRRIPVLILPTKSGAYSNVTTFQLTSTTSPAGVDFRDTTMDGVDALGQRFNYRTTFEPASQSRDPSFAVQSTKTFNSLSDAVIEAQRINSMARYTLTAKFGVAAYLPIEVGRHVIVQDPDALYGGWWYVTDVSQTLNDTVASTYITAVRSVGQLASTIPVLPSRPPQVVLRSGHWQLDRNWVRAA